MLTCARELAVVSLRAAAFFLVLLGSCTRQPSAVGDRNGDGRIQLLCIGDSNTDPGRAGLPKWCELLAAKHPEWQVRDGGLSFARAVGDCMFCGHTMLDEGIRQYSPDVVLIALGTNDIVMLRNPAEVAVDALLALRDQAVAANADVFVATIPPTYTGEDTEHFNQQIDAANALLAQRLPANRLIDFHSNMPKEDFDARGLHLNREGQEKRAAAADAALTAR